MSPVRFEFECRELLLCSHLPSLPLKLPKGAAQQAALETCHLRHLAVDQKGRIAPSRDPKFQNDRAASAPTHI